MVSASDALETGYGVSTAAWEKEAVSRIGQEQERSRYTYAWGADTWRNALEKGGFVYDLARRRWVVDDGDTRLEPGDAGFPEVEAGLLKAELWEPRLAGEWQCEEGILLLEARALLLSPKRPTATRYGRRMRQLLLVDNMSVCLAFERSRASSHTLLLVVRKLCAWCLVRDIAPAIRWIPSEFNSADEGSGPARHAVCAGSRI